MGAFFFSSCYICIWHQTVRMLIQKNIDIDYFVTFILLKLSISTMFSSPSFFILFFFYNVAASSNRKTDVMSSLLTHLTAHSEERSFSHCAPRREIHHGERTMATQTNPHLRKFQKRKHWFKGVGRSLQLTSLLTFNCFLCAPLFY